LAARAFKVRDGDQRQSGETVQLKINAASAYRIDIYRSALWSDPDAWLDEADFRLESGRQLFDSLISARREHVSRHR